MFEALRHFFNRIGLFDCFPHSTFCQTLVQLFQTNGLSQECGVEALRYLRPLLARLRVGTHIDPLDVLDAILVRYPELAQSVLEWNLVHQLVPDLAHFSAEATLKLIGLFPKLIVDDDAARVLCEAGLVESFKTLVNQSLHLAGPIFECLAASVNHPAIAAELAESDFLESVDFEGLTFGCRSHFLVCVARVVTDGAGKTPPFADGAMRWLSGAIGWAEKPLLLLALNAVAGLAHGGRKVPEEGYAAIEALTNNEDAEIADSARVIVSYITGYC
jgi:hypothetical protein